VERVEVDAFSKVLSTETFYSKCTRVLTFQNFWVAVDDRQVQAIFAEMNLDEQEKIRQERAIGQSFEGEQGGGTEEVEEDFVAAGGNTAGEGTLVVVTVVVALDAQALPELRDRKSLTEALSVLLSLSGEKILEVDVLYTRQDLSQSLTPDMVTLDYPGLIPLDY
jgi:uncharacterized membrane protein